MNNELTELIKNEILKYDELIKNLNRKLSMYKPVYDVLKPKRGNLNKDNISFLSFDKKTLNMLMDAMEQVNVVLVDKIIQNKMLYEAHNKEVEKSLKEYGLSKEIIFSKTFMGNIKIKSAYNPKLKIVYDKLVLMKQRDDELFKINEEIVLYIYKSMIDMYEEIKDEKERLKENKKYLEYALNNLKSKQRLTPRDISVITEVINSCLDADIKQMLSEEFTLYLSNFKKKDKDSNVTLTEVNHEVKPHYVDDVCFEPTNQEEESDTCLYNNYITSIKSFNNFEDVNTFLNSISYDCDIKKMLLKMISLLGNTNEDKLLKDYLKEYLSSFDETEEKEEPGKEIFVFYYGFLQRKNRIFNDVLKGNIPKEYYDDVLTGLEMIKQDGAKAKRKSITRIRKVFKLRVRDIRITYKKLSNNAYVILGVFCKKDHRGYDVINTTFERNNDLIGSEKMVIEAMKIQDVWNEYVSINDDFEKELDKLLSSNKK